MSYPAARHETAKPPRRVFAVGGAAAITIVSLAGAFGIGPGAVDRGTPATQPFEANSVPTAPFDATLHAASGSQPTPESAGGASPARTPPQKPQDVSDGDKQTSDTVLSAGTGHGRRIVFDISDQRVWLVAGNQVARTYAVSGSRSDNLDPGRYSVYSMSRHATSFDGRETMNFMVRFTHGDNAAIGFHDIPAFVDGRLAQSRADLGTAKSAGCVRQWITDAKALWEFSDVGTSVVVTA